MFDSKYCNTYATLFNVSFLTKVASNTHRSFLSSLVRNSKANFDSAISLGDFFDQVYSILESLYRCEYIYKNTIANELLTRHTLSEACLFHEFNANGSKADVVIVNGTTTAYEIKTELDSLTRLASQIEAYSKVFDRVNIVTHLGLIDKVKSLFDERVGIIAFQSDNSLYEIRSALSNINRFDSSAIFNCLRADEYSKIVFSELGKRPEVPNTQRYTVYKDLFCTLDNSTIHRHFTKILQARFDSRKAENLIYQAPCSLKLLYLTAKFPANDLAIIHQRVISALSL